MIHWQLGSPLAAAAAVGLGLLWLRGSGAGRRGGAGTWKGDRPGRTGAHFRTPRTGGIRGAARWARRGELAALRIDARRPSPRGRLVLGRAGAAVPAGRRLLLAAERHQSVAVVGPTQSGKTTGLAVPAILGWEGPVVAASVKTDLAAATGRWRRQLGQVWYFDPTGSTGLPPSTWSPLGASATWVGARRAAADLTEVARGPGTTADGEFWYATAAKLLAPLLFAAARGGRGMADVVRWVDTQEVVEVAELLEEAGVPAALDAARASWLRDERQRSAVYTTAETVLEPFADPPPGTTGVGEIDPVALLSGRHTLYLCAPAHDQRRLRGVFAAMVKQVLDTAFAAASRRRRPLDPPLLVVLDEAANIAPLAELDVLAATCAGHGVQLLTVWQDMAQISARYGPRAATVLNNHRGKLFLSGTADAVTLDHASRLVGEEEPVLASSTRDPSGAVSTTRTSTRRPLLPPDRLRRLPPGAGILVYGSLPPVEVVLRPWWDDPRLARWGDR